jgi:hypothetical protein
MILKRISETSRKILMKINRGHQVLSIWKMMMKTLISRKSDLKRMKTIFPHRQLSSTIWTLKLGTTFILKLLNPRTFLILAMVLIVGWTIMHAS